jgi:hypothetical protein
MLNFFLQVSIILLPLFALKQKVEPKVQGRHDRSAHAAVPSHKSQSLGVNTFPFEINSFLQLLSSPRMVFFDAAGATYCRRSIPFRLLYSKVSYQTNTE